MLICDTHADTLWRIAKGSNGPFDVTADMLTDPCDTRVQALALYVSTGGMDENPSIVEKELAAFETVKKQGFRPITKIEDAQPGVPNALLTIEGCEAFRGDTAQVERFAALGVRIAAIIWNNENGLAHPAVSGSHEGLTPLGREIVQRMRECHIAADVSHLNERGTFELMDGPVPPMASHSCAKKLCDHPRNLSDEQLRTLFRQKAFVGVNFYPSFLREDGTATIDTVIDHMAYMCDLGGEDCVGLGSDFDGIETHPDGLHTAADVPALLRRMLKRGFGQSLTEKIAGLNFKRYLAMI